MFLLDYKIILLCLLVLIFVSIGSTMFDKTSNGSTNIRSTNPSNNNNNNSTTQEDVQINQQMYDRAVDIVTDYSLKSTEYDDKMTLIYLSTFHIFDMNFSHASIEKLDDSLESYPYVPNSTEFPEGSMHHNLQKAIITNISTCLSNDTAYQLVHDRVKDRVLIDMYLNNLFNQIGVDGR